MKKIVMTTLKSEGTKDFDGNDVVFMFNGYTDAPMGDEWNGDVSGYVDNYIDVSRDISGTELHVVDGVTVDRAPGGAIVLADEDNYPREMFWVVESDADDE